MKCEDRDDAIVAELQATQLQNAIAAIDKAMPLHPQAYPHGSKPAGICARFACDHVKAVDSGLCVFHLAKWRKRQAERVARHAPTPATVPTDCYDIWRAEAEARRDQMQRAHARLATENGVF